MPAQIKGETKIDCSTTHWTTKDEIDFINKIGTQFSQEHGPSKYTKKQLIKKYINNIKKRVVWGNIDRNEVFVYATGMLNSL